MEEAEKIGPPKLLEKGDCGGVDGVADALATTSLC
jgi:hypothetical protein